MTDRGWEIRVVTPEPSGHRRRRFRIRVSARRLVLMTMVVTALTAGGLTDALVGRATTSRGASNGAVTVADATGSAVPAVGAESSAWFCVGGVTTGSVAPVTLEFTNPTARVVRGTVSAVSATGPGQSFAVAVPAHSQVPSTPSQAGSGSWVAATVVFDGGGVGVSEVVTGPLGWSSSPCASATSSRWYFAHGSTDSGSLLSLLLYDPLTTDAVVDVGLDSSTEGFVEPPAYQGVPVAAHSLVVENLGDHLLNDPSVGAEVTTLSGAVVAAELLTTPLGNGGGTSLLLGAPTAVRKWEFPQNLNPSGGAVVFDILNPSAKKASVRVDVGLAEGQAEPLRVEVQPHSVVGLNTESETRIPTGTPYSLTFSAPAGSGIVVDREIAVPPGSTSPQTGEVRGVAGGFDRLLVPAVASSSDDVGSLAISDVGSKPVRVTVTEAQDGAAVPGLTHKMVSPREPLVIQPPPGSPIGLVPLLVRSSGPVAVEADEGPSGSQGVVVLPALATR